MLAGEVVSADQKGMCAGHNNVIQKLPETLPQAIVVPAYGCQAGRDRLHFSLKGVRELGRRYAGAMLTTMGL